MQGTIFDFRGEDGQLTRRLRFAKQGDFAVHCEEFSDLKCGSQNFIIGKGQVSGHVWNKIRALKDHFEQLKAQNPSYLSECKLGETWMFVRGGNEEVRFSIYRAPQARKRLSDAGPFNSGGVKILTKGNHRHNITIAASHPHGRKVFFQGLFDILSDLSSSRKTVHIFDSFES